MKMPQWSTDYAMRLVRTELLLLFISAVIAYLIGRWTLYEYAEIVTGWGFLAILYGVLAPIGLSSYSSNFLFMTASTGDYRSTEGKAHFEIRDSERNSAFMFYWLFAGLIAVGIGALLHQVA
jgi:hypothetical protein